MKIVKFRILFPVILVFIVSSILVPGTVQAFHRGGVGRCDGCHIMHNVQGGNARWLLPGTETSSVCLNCHTGEGSSGSPNIASPDGSAMSPGGDFYWLTRDFVWAGGSSAGDSHGHNIIAWDYGFSADSRLTASPGGSYLSAELGCTSCHDPHGKVSSGLPVTDSGSYGSIPVAGTATGNYRLLGGRGYSGGAHTRGYYFNNDAPVARQNFVMPFGETDSSHVDYGYGMSEWCSNCHDYILLNDHKSVSNDFEHPAGNNASLNEVVDAYNRYIKTGDFSGLRATSYLALVPFERGVSDTTLLDPVSTLGPDSSSNIMCLTCHRAHASAFRYAGRWDFSAQIIADSHPAAGDSGVTGSDLLYSYYGRDMMGEFGPDQRSLCEKCHEVPRDGYPPGW